MDPNETLARMLSAYEEGDFREARDAAEDLMRWHERGGFVPAGDRLMAAFPVMIRLCYERLFRRNLGDWSPKG